MSCLCGNPEKGFDCVCDHIRKFEGDGIFVCPQHGVYSAGESICERCEVAEEYEDFDDLDEYDDFYFDDDDITEEDIMIEQDDDDDRIELYDNEIGSADIEENDPYESDSYVDGDGDIIPEDDPDDY